jgi:GNAT superfamily N-acetyltransferase
VWLRRAEQKFAKVGGHRVRIYLHTQVPTLEAILRANDYRPRTELAFGRFSAPQESPTGLRLKRVVSEAVWGDKLSLHEAAHAASERAPDGHAFDAKTWLDLERAKSRAGELVYLLAYMGVTPCATIGLAVVGSVLRIKNVLVHPHWRHRGIATRLFSCAGALAGSRQLALGVLAVEGGAGEALYRRAGFDVWASLFEWTAPE